MAAGTHWRLHYHLLGIYDGLYGQSVAGVGRVGLQWAFGQYTWADMPAVFYSVAAGGANRNYNG